jgi:hypothetical protein
MFIDEVTSRCDFSRGVLQPFICRLNDSEYYFAKGSNSGVRGLISEWIAANMAHAFGLPTPPCTIAYLDPTLKSILDPAWQADLEFENLFASRSVMPCETVTITDLAAIPSTLQRDVFVFDYWVQNEDRHLGETAGNVNLLFQPHSQSLQVIDFNLAFADDFNPSDMSTHVFHDALASSPIDLDDQSKYGARFEKCIAELEVFISAIPDEWIEYSPSSSAILQRIREQLSRYRRDDFWGGLTW